VNKENTVDVWERTFFKKAFLKLEDQIVIFYEIIKTDMKN
jgi:hypothetical protein